MGWGISFWQGGCIVAELSFGNQDAEFSLHGEAMPDLEIGLFLGYPPEE